MARINWRGRQVLANVMAAATRAIDETTRDCARGAQGDAPPGSKDKVHARPARTVGTEAAGQWGLYDHPRAAHAVAVERGGAKWPGDPYLQPQQDQHYPRLAGRIRTELGQ